MKEVKRENAIDELAQHDLDTLEGRDLYEIFKVGCKGYENYNNEELAEIYHDVFFDDEDIKVVD